MSDFARQLPCLQRSFEFLETHWQEQRGSPRISTEQLRRSWEAVLQAWRAQPSWRGAPQPPDPLVLAGLRIVAAGRNPFGAENAEDDPLLIETRHQLPAFSTLKQQLPIVVRGPSGSGKTAAALTLAHDALKEHGPLDSSLFPVYCAWRPALRPADVATAAAQTLLHYLVVNPHEFNQCTPEAQINLLRLLTTRLGPEPLSAHLSRAGFPRTAQSQPVLDELDHCLADAELSPAEADPLTLLPYTLPSGFVRHLVLVDGRANSPEETKEIERWLAQWLEPLGRAGLLVKAFLPCPGANTPHPDLPVPVLAWRWTSDDLAELLHKRLALIREDTLAAWCQMPARLLEPDRLVLKAADSPSPRLLFRLGNAFLRRIGQKGERMGVRDVLISLADGLAEPMPAPSALHGAGQRWAVLVSVGQYEDSLNYGPLEVCLADAQAIHAQLVAGGFDSARIRLLSERTDEKPRRAKILTALQALANATEPDDVLVFYYTGHGDTAEGEGYLVAQDGHQLTLADTAVPISRVKSIMERAAARAKIIILDACHSGANIRGKGPQPMSAEFLRRVFEQAEGLAILASCKQGELSYYWPDQSRSVFTYFLLEALRGEADRDGKGFVTVQDVNRHVVNGVKLWASQRNLSQTPTFQYAGAGDIILTRQTS